jgi:predicted DNA-binding transcriptional regulator YafY
VANPFANSVKFLTAINLLSSAKGATIKTLMERLAVSRRTAFRLLEALEELGLPLVDEQSKSGNQKVYRLMDSYVHKLPNMAIPNPGLTPEEVEMLITIMNLVDQIRKLGNEAALFSIRNKIAALLPQEMKDRGKKEKNS